MYLPVSMFGIMICSSADHECDFYASITPEILENVTMQWLNNHTGQLVSVNSNHTLTYIVHLQKEFNLELFANIHFISCITVGSLISTNLIQKHNFHLLQICELIGAELREMILLHGRMISLVLSHFSSVYFLYCSFPLPQL